jgi:tRNA U34 5-carboxymethylaminomethyl modifying enzyme MnmG/GidA
MLDLAGIQFKVLNKSKGPAVYVRSGKKNENIELLK